MYLGLNKVITTVVGPESNHTQAHITCDKISATIITPPRAPCLERPAHSLADWLKNELFNLAGLLALMACVALQFIHFLALIVGYSVICLAISLLAFVIKGLPSESLWSRICDFASP